MSIKDDLILQQNLQEGQTQVRKFVIRSAARRIEWQRRSMMNEAASYEGESLRLQNSSKAYHAHKNAPTIIPRLFEAIICLSRNHAAYTAALNELAGHWGEQRAEALAGIQVIFDRTSKRIHQDATLRAQLTNAPNPLINVNCHAEVGYPTVYIESADPRGVVIRTRGDAGGLTPDNESSTQGETSAFLEFDEKLIEKLRIQAEQLKARENYEPTENWREVKAIIDSYGDDIENRAIESIVLGLTSTARRLIWVERVYQLTINEVANSWGERKAELLKDVEGKLHAEAKRLDEDPAFISRIVTWAKSRLGPDSNNGPIRPTL